jgi:hypothetical protein
MGQEGPVPLTRIGIETGTGTGTEEVGTKRGLVQGGYSANSTCRAPLQQQTIPALPTQLSCCVDVYRFCWQLLYFKYGEPTLPCRCTMMMPLQGVQALAGSLPVGPVAAGAAPGAPLQVASPPSQGRRSGHDPQLNHVLQTMVYVYLHTPTVLPGETTVS